MSDWGCCRMQLVTVETPWLGNRSYVVIDGGSADGRPHALAVDPPRDIDRVNAVLEQFGAALDLVVETHRHADYVSGGLQLSREHGAEYVVPPGAPDPAFGFTPAIDRD